jgi:putative SOS response-associated peptidase YedK
MCGRSPGRSCMHSIVSAMNYYRWGGRQTQPRFSIAPTQDVDFVALNKGGNLELLQGRWWLVPHWAKELPKSAMLNARIETVDSTAAFRDAWRYRRCLIPADGYFEWTASEDGGGKDPWLLQLPEGEASALPAYGRAMTTWA